MFGLHLYQVLFPFDGLSRLYEYGFDLPVLGA